jgi:hypothetical protein
MEALRFNPDTPFTRKILLRLCISWIEDNDHEYLLTHPIAEVEDTLNQLFVILLDLFEIYKFPRHMFVPVVIYANRFVSKYGIKHNQLFNLLLTRYTLLLCSLFMHSTIFSFPSFFLRSLH